MLTTRFLGVSFDKRGNRIEKKMNRIVAASFFFGAVIGASSHLKVGARSNGLDELPAEKMVSIEDIIEKRGGMIWMPSSILREVPLNWGTFDERLIINYKTKKLLGESSVDHLVELVDQYLLRSCELGRKHATLTRIEDQVYEIDVNPGGDVKNYPEQLERDMLSATGGTGVGFILSAHVASRLNECFPFMKGEKVRVVVDLRKEAEFAWTKFRQDGTSSRSSTIPMPEGMFLRSFRELRNLLPSHGANQPNPDSGK